LARRKKPRAKGNTVHLKLAGILVVNGKTQGPSDLPALGRGKPSAHGKPGFRDDERFVYQFA
jgi:hypothetical protein